MAIDPDWDPSQYEVSFPDIVYTGPLIEAPIPFKATKVSGFLITVLKDAVESIRVGAELPALLLCLAAVDYVAGFNAGHKTTQKDYVEFMRRFFPPSYAPHLERIYVDLRCGLMHNLSMLNPWNSVGPPFLLAGDRAGHLTVVDGVAVFSVLAFAEDVRRSWFKYAHMLVMKPEADQERRFNERFNRLGGAAALMDKVAD